MRSLGPESCVTALLGLHKTVMLFAGITPPALEITAQDRYDSTAILSRDSRS